MNDELERYYELLGVAPGTNGRELKEAYRDLAKVWHPDRFSHDPRLQQKAQEKLKAINEAYDRLTSGSAGRRPRTAPTPERPRAHAAEAGVRKRPRSLLPTALVFCAAFVAAFIALVPPGARPAPDHTPPAEQEEVQPPDKGQQPEGVARAAAGQTARGKERAGRQPPAESTSGGDPGSEPGVRQLRPMPTVTVTIDAANGLLATRDCPSVSTMTYPAGNEPRQYCAVQHKPPPPKESRLKSVGKRLAAPFN